MMSNIRVSSSAKWELSAEKRPHGHAQEIRQIRIHLRGERRDRDTPTDRRNVPVTNAPCPAPNPSLGDEYPRHPNSCQSYLFSIPSSPLLMSQAQDLNRSLFKKTYWCCSFELPFTKTAVPSPRCPLKDLEGPCPGLGAGADQQAAEQAHPWAPDWAAGALAWHPPASLTLLRRMSEGLKDSPPSPRYAVQETNAGCPTSSGLVLNFNLFGHLLNCY